MLTVRVGIVGLGRLGQLHAENLAKKIPNATLVAACSLSEKSLNYAKNELGVQEIYKDFEEMVSSPNLDAICIVSPSGYHTEQICQAMERGLHVFCEKPIGLDVDEIEKTIEVINSYPNQVFHLGFMRRYDKSYRYAKQMVQEGKLGELTLIRSYGMDPASQFADFVKFATASDSGGIFHDMGVHDIDLIRWFSNSEVKKVWSLGVNKAYPELERLNELETAAAFMQLENDIIAILVVGRNAPHGYHVETELIGTKGMLRIAAVPEKNLVTVFDENGVVRPTFQSFQERFANAYYNELEEFINCILEKRRPSVTARDGLQATKVAIACQKSFVTQEVIEVEKLFTKK